MKYLHDINILGRRLQVRSSATPEQVQEIAAFVNRKVDEVKAAVGDADTQTVMILTLMNMAETCLSASASEVKSPSEADERISAIIRRIEEVVG